MLMRTRTVGPVYKTLGPTQAEALSSSPGSVWEPYTFGSAVDNPLNVLQRLETMEDIPNPPPPCGYKPCKHVKLVGDWSDEAIHTTVYRGGAGPTWSWKLGTSHTLAYYHPSVVSYVEDLADTPVAELNHGDRWAMSSVWEKAKPHLEPNLNLLVFLAEIRELPELAKSLAGKLSKIFGSGAGKRALKSIDGLKALASHKDVGVGGMLKVVMDDVSHAISSQWIEYNFAIAPTVSELMGILTAIFEYGKKLDDLIQGAGKKQKAHFSFAYSEEVDNEMITGVPCTKCPFPDLNIDCPFEGSLNENIWDDASVPGSWAYRSTPGGRDTRIGLTVFYRYELPDWVNQVSSRINALAAALGVNPGLGVIWELIPFSFVIDWVFPIGDILERARVDAIPVKTEILDICWTKRVTESVVIHATTGRCPLGRDVLTVYQGKLETFQRIIGTEPFTWIPAFRWPNLFQLSLGAALVDLFRKR